MKKEVPFQYFSRNKLSTFALDVEGCNRTNFSAMTATNCSLAKLDYPDSKTIAKLTIADPRGSSTFTSLANRLLILEHIHNSSDYYCCTFCRCNLSASNPIAK